MMKIKKLIMENKIMSCILFIVMIIIAVLINFLKKKYIITIVTTGVMALVGGVIILKIYNLDNGEKVYIYDIEGKKECYKMSSYSKFSISRLIIGLLVVSIGSIAIAVLGEKESITQVIAVFVLTGFCLTIMSMISIPKCLELEDKRLTYKEIKKIEESLKEKGIITIEQMNQYSKILKEQNTIKNKYGKANKIYKTIIFLPFIEYIRCLYIEKNDLSSIVNMLVAIGVISLIIDWIIMLRKVHSKYDELTDEKIIIAIEQIKLKRMLD